MATSKQQPDTELPRPKSSIRAAAATADSGLPEVDFETPLYEREASAAEKARREAAVEAFRNEKAHERPPRRQA
ncbi:hypothetical protein DSM21852_37290 [Methylocystis bryophila]|nr:hypothetical protein DSM21852_37290 [Methylocystis bryophila]